MKAFILSLIVLAAITVGAAALLRDLPMSGAAFSDVRGKRQ